MPSVTDQRSENRGQRSAEATEGCPSRAGADAALDARHSVLGTVSGKTYWRSLEELADTPEFRRRMADEFPAGAMELLDGNDRRGFLKIMGASMALAGITLSGCRRWPEQKMAPYAHRPEDRTPGVPEFFATGMELGGVTSGLLITSFDGRPTKIEGNPQHPITRGASDSWMQASVLDLYDPDRSRHVLHRGDHSAWREFAAWAKDRFETLRANQGRGLAVLSQATGSPSVLDMKERLAQAMPQATWHEYEPINNDQELQGSVLAFGSPQRTHLMLEQAKVVVSLDADFMTCHGAAVQLIRDVAAARRVTSPQDEPARLYAFESTLSLTGANADHRGAMRSADVAIVAAHLAMALAPGSLAAALRPFESAVPSGWTRDEYQRLLQAMIDDLEAHRGRSAIVVGRHQSSQAHLLGHVLNVALGNVGATVRYTPVPESSGHLDSIQSLVRAMSADRIDTLVILGGNPVYDAPADLAFDAALKHVANVVHLGDYADETAMAAGTTWHLPRAHYLEAWGDGRAYDGTLTITQPLIEPLWGGRSAIELLALVIGDQTTAGYDIVRRTFAEFTGSMDMERLWRQTLHDGLLRGSEWTASAPALQPASALAAAMGPWSPPAPDAGQALEVVFVPDSKVYDGRFANNGWLQELPDAITKLTWDNAVIMGPATAQRLGVKTEDLVRLTVNGGGRSVDAAVVVVPGQHEGSLTLPLGYGRSFNGRVCAGAGFNFYRLRTARAMGFAGGADVRKIEGAYALAMTQDHHAIDPQSVGGKGVQERLPTLFREADLEEYRRDARFAAGRVHVVHRLSLWTERELEGPYAWAMSIDLNACVGCGACVTACVAENNIPVVGKDQVRRGREMHWIRVDRYFQFQPAEVDGHGVVKRWDPLRMRRVALQPVTCMHCENAPCEQVCPVAATVHDHDGLNVMIYNRCVGTRYCSNNCPYKVRRFNYFDYQVRKPVRDAGFWTVTPDYYTTEQSGTEPLKRLQHNPEVTVRSRGVMEKCTYCVQRLSAAKIKAKNAFVKLDPAQRPQRVTVPDADIMPACGQACPAQAIVFGDLNNPQSAVVARHQHERSYMMLEEINTKARTRYLAKVRNPNPDLAEADHPSSLHTEASSHG